MAAAGLNCSTKDLLSGLQHAESSKVGSQEIPGVTGKIGLGVQNKAGQRLTEFCQESALVTANTLFQQHRTSNRVFSSESVLHIRWPKYWSFSLSISPFSEYSGLISFRKDWLDLLAVQGTKRHKKRN